MENHIINLLLNHGTFSERTSKPILYHTVKMAHSIHVGQKFERLSIERHQSAESVQFYMKDSRTGQKAKLCLQKKKGRVVDRTSFLLFSSPVHY